MPMKIAHTFHKKMQLRLHHNFFDPSQVIGTPEEKQAAFLKVRNGIKEYCQKFVLREID